MKSQTPARLTVIDNSLTRRPPGSLAFAPGWWSLRRWGMSDSHVYVGISHFTQEASSNDRNLWMVLGLVM